MMSLGVVSLREMDASLKERNVVLGERDVSLGEKMQLLVKRFGKKGCKIVERDGEFDGKEM